MNQSDQDKKNDFRDRRIFIRFPIKLPIKFLPMGKQKKSKAETIDISANGIGFISKTEMSRNTPLEIWLDAPNRDKPLYFAGKVIWSKIRGVKFQQWRTGVLLKLANLIDLGRLCHHHLEKID